MTSQLATAALTDRLKGGLVVSCQPVPGGPFDDPASVVRFALAAQNAGARALRIEGVANVAAVAAACSLPIIGLVKRDLHGYARPDHTLDRGHPRAVRGRCSDHRLRCH